MRSTRQRLLLLAALAILPALACRPSGRPLTPLAWGDRYEIELGPARQDGTAPGQPGTRGFAQALHVRGPFGGSVRTFQIEARLDSRQTHEAVSDDLTLERTSATVDVRVEEGGARLQAQGTLEDVASRSRSAPGKTLLERALALELNRDGSPVGAVERGEAGALTVRLGATSHRFHRTRYLVGYLDYVDGKLFANVTDAYQHLPNRTVAWIQAGAPPPAVDQALLSFAVVHALSSLLWQPPE
jgi:hypothetical protein